MIHGHASAMGRRGSATQSDLHQFHDRLDVALLDVLREQLEINRSLCEVTYAYHSFASLLSQLTEVSSSIGIITAMIASRSCGRPTLSSAALTSATSISPLPVIVRAYHLRRVSRKSP